MGGRNGGTSGIEAGATGAAICNAAFGTGASVAKRGTVSTALHADAQ